MLLESKRENSTNAHFYRYYSIYSIYRIYSNANRAALSGRPVCVMLCID